MIQATPSLAAYVTGVSVMTRRLEPIEVVRAACGVVRSPGVGPAESATHGRWRPTYEKGAIMSRERP